MVKTSQKILLVLPRFPLPADKGDKLRAWEQIRVLAEENDVYLFCVSDEPVPQAEFAALSALVREVQVVQLSSLSVLWSACRALFSGLPFQVAYYRNSEAYTKLERFVQRIDPDAVFFQLVRMATYRKAAGRRTTVLDFMDCMSHNVYLRLQTEGFPDRIFWRSEYKRLLRYEAAVQQAFTHSCIISERDRDTLPFAAKDQVQIVSNGIDLERFRPSEKVPECDLLFVGNLGYKPNIEACVWLVREILPLLHQKNVYPSLRLVGSNPDARVQELSTVKNVELYASVPDTVPYYQSARIMVAPMRINTGQQNKVLEAMACGLPVITTSNANDGIRAPEGCVCVGDTAEELAAHILSLLNDPARTREMGQRARLFVEEHFSWHTHTRVLQQLLTGN